MQLSTIFSLADVAFLAPTAMGKGVGKEGEIGEPKSRCDVMEEHQLIIALP